MLTLRVLHGVPISVQPLEPERLVQQLNVGTLDAAIRWLLAAALGAASVALDLSMILSLLVAMLALGMAASALMHFCPLYSRLGMSTRHRTPVTSTRHS